MADFLAVRETAKSARPLEVQPVTGLTAQQQHDDVLDIDDVIGKRIITTRLVRSVTVREENAAAALEAMSRSAVNPKWLIYLPPTMSPSETSDRPDCLEHPDETFEYFRRQGVERVVCEQKHMGSRVVVIVCRDEKAATRRFGVIGEGMGICYTRTGRPFFDDAATQAALLERVRGAITAAGLWEELATDWLCLDCELMPWSPQGPRTAASPVRRRRRRLAGRLGRNRAGPPAGRAADLRRAGRRPVLADAGSGPQPDGSSLHRELPAVLLERQLPG